MIDMTPSLIQTWGHLDSLGCKQVTIWDPMHRRRTLGHAKLREKKKRRLETSKKSPQKGPTSFCWHLGKISKVSQKRDALWGCGVDGFASNKDRKWGIQFITWAVEERKKPWLDCRIVGYTRYEILSFVFIGSMSSQQPFAASILFKPWWINGPSNGWFQTFFDSPWSAKNAPIWY